MQATLFASLFYGFSNVLAQRIGFVSSKDQQCH